MPLIDLAAIEYPIIVTSNNSPTSMTYVASTKVFTGTIAPVAYAFLVDDEEVEVDVTGTFPTDRVLTLGFKVNADGTLDPSGSSDTNLVIKGNVDIDDDASDDYTGILLTGKLLRFGSDADSGQGYFNFEFEVTGGALSDLFTDKNAGMTIVSGSTTFTGIFTEDWSGRVTSGITGPVTPFVPDPGGGAAGVAFGLMVPPMFARRRR